MRWADESSRRSCIILAKAFRGWGFSGIPCVRQTASLKFSTFCFSRDSVSCCCQRRLSVENEENRLKFQRVRERVCVLSKLSGIIHHVFTSVWVSVCIILLVLGVNTWILSCLTLAWEYGRKLRKLRDFCARYFDIAFGIDKVVQEFAFCQQGAAKWMGFASELEFYYLTVHKVLWYELTANDYLIIFICSHFLPGMNAASSLKWVRPDYRLLWENL